MRINKYEKKRKTDFHYKLAHNIRVRTRQTFKSQNVEKLNKNFDLIGCFKLFLRKWILYQLHGDLSEENYGSVWTIDHCYLLSKRNVSNENYMCKFSTWVSVRPMFYNKNSSKGSKFDNRLCLLPEVKAKYFLKLNDQEGLNEDLH